MKNLTHFATRCPLLSVKQTFSAGIRMGQGFRTVDLAARIAQRANPPIRMDQRCHRPAAALTDLKFAQSIFQRARCFSPLCVKLENVFFAPCCVTVFISFSLESNLIYCFPNMPHAWLAEEDVTASTKQRGVSRCRRCRRFFKPT